MKTSLVVANDFYTHPLKVRELGLQRAWLPDQPAYLPPRIQDRLAGLVGRKITKHPINKVGYRDSGTFALQNARNSFTLAVHHDLGAYEYVGIVYLTPNAPQDAGTSFWKHKKTGLISAPTPSDARRLDTTVEQLYKILEEDREDRTKWYEQDRVGNKFNRIVIFRAGHLHSATKVFGRNTETSRLTQIFNFSTR